MTRFNCYFGDCAGNEELPKWLTRRNLISEIFFEASSKDINITAGAISSIGRGPQVGLNAYELQTALEAITENSDQVKNIGVIFADVFAPHPSSFGVLFDPGPGFGFPDTNNFPREGCAVFLGAIRQTRAGTAPQETGVFGDPFEAESFFTTMHELGHVFNLWHSESTINYMDSSAKSTLAGRSDSGFTDIQREFLKLCSSSPAVRPGGWPFGIRGSHWPAEREIFSKSNRKLGDLKIRIRVTDDEFFAFQPVELEVSVSATEGHRAGFIEIPDVVHPGYQDFAIWLEEPSGKRRKFRSPRQYCPSASVLRINKSNPFQRDISLFYDANGFFFREPGPHKLWVTLKVSKGLILRSKTINLRVLARNDSIRAYKRLAPILSQPVIARTLYHRYCSRRAPILSLLQHASTEFIRSNPKVSKEIHYVLGRIYHAHATRTKTNQIRRELRATSFRHFDAASKGSHLSEHRRHVMERLVRDS